MLNTIRGYLKLQVVDKKDEVYRLYPSVMLWINYSSFYQKI
ncbi:hypothetical protein FDUTEX481_09732 [Tolypothrix sp. PCC 7601]|nr:hypothetical protein FDUTEX481_09732 [Tolypothrix sp. PCC 7601]